MVFKCTYRKYVVVSIGAILTFKVIFTPLEYVPTIPPLSSYVINVLYFSNNKSVGSVRNILAPPFSLPRAG